MNRRRHHSIANPPLAHRPPPSLYSVANGRCLVGALRLQAGSAPVSSPNPQVVSAAAQQLFRGVPQVSRPLPGWGCLHVVAAAPNAEERRGLARCVHVSAASRTAGPSFVGYNFQGEKHAWRLIVQPAPSFEDFWVSVCLCTARVPSCCLFQWRRRASKPTWNMAVPIE